MNERKEYHKDYYDKKKKQGYYQKNKKRLLALQRKYYQQRLKEAREAQKRLEASDERDGTWFEFQQAAPGTASVKALERYMASKLGE